MVVDYYGLGDCAPLTLTRMAKKYEKTTYFVKQDLTRAMRIMRNALGVSMEEN